MPYVFSELERLDMRCQLDGLMCVLYGLERVEVELVLESFTVLHRQELKRYGGRETFDRVLLAFERFKPLL